MNAAAANIFDHLSQISETKELNPFRDLDLDQAPAKEQPWLPEYLVSLHGTSAYDALSREQRIALSQKEFCLIASVSCFGEKEIIANLARLMLKPQLARYRRYIHHLIREENNHIHMFAEFCTRYGALYPVYYPASRGESWDDEALLDLIVFVRILIFEELGTSLNEVIAKDKAMPPLVREINRFHTYDEGRHISFGRHLLQELVPAAFEGKPPEILGKFRAYVSKYLDTRHVDLYNAGIYESVGIRDAQALRERLVAEQDVRHFARNQSTGLRLQSLVRFLESCQLIDGHPVLEAEAAA
jgi:hypothetical protein